MSQMNLLRIFSQDNSGLSEDTENFVQCFSFSGNVRRLLKFSKESYNKIVYFTDKVQCLFVLINFIVESVLKFFLLKLIEINQ